MPPRGVPRSKITRITCEWMKSGPCFRFREEIDVADSSIKKGGVAAAKKGRGRGEGLYLKRAIRELSLHVGKEKRRGPTDRERNPGGGVYDACLLDNLENTAGKKLGPRRRGIGVKRPLARQKARRNQKK